MRVLPYLTTRLTVQSIWNISRFQLVQILWNHAEPLGVTFQFGHEISSVTDEADHARIEASDGSILKYDLVIGADGES
mgnify:CR=1 FL=1